MNDLHAGDALSDLLDGRLTVDAAAALRAHVIGCAHCSAELDAVREARASVRSLPAVEPPTAYIEAVLAITEPDERGSGRLAAVLPLRRSAAMANAAAAVVAGAFIVLGAGGAGAGAVAPGVGGAVEQHAATISAISTGLGAPDPLLPPDEVSPTTLPRRSTDVPRPYLAPKSLGAYRLADAFRSERGVYLLYQKDQYALSVFEQEGNVDFAGLPALGERLQVGGDDAWRWTGPRADGRVLVLERDGVVITLVGDESAGAVLAAARQLPPGARSLPIGTRVRRACGDALDALSPAG